MAFNFLKKTAGRHYLSLIILTLLTFAVYINALNNEFLSDDIASIRDNPQIGTFESIVQQPVVFTQNLFYAIVFHISGLAPAGFRLLNILFHLGSVLTLYAILYLQLRKKEVAFFAAAIFAVHPLLIESVTWISGGNYVRYSFFFLFSFLAYLLSRKNTTWYVISLVSLLLSIFSSEKAIVLPIMFFIYELFLIPKGERSWKKIIPYALIWVAWVLFYIPQVAQRQANVQSSSFGGHWFNPLIQIPTAISSYFQLIFWPDKLTLYHTELSYPPWDFGLRVGITVVYFLALLFFLKKDNLVFFWLSLLVVSLSHSLTPIPIAWIVAERYVYLGTLGIIVVVVYFAYKVCKSPLQQKILSVLFVIIIVALSYRTIVRNIDWKNQDNLWIATGKISPSSPVNHNNLGDVYMRWHQYNRSEAEFKRAIQIDPRYAEAYHNLGNLYKEWGKIDKAMASFQKAYEFKPSLWQPPHAIAEIYFSRKEYDKALEYMKKSSEADPYNADLVVDVGIVYMGMGDRENARQAFEYALQLNPQHLRAQLGLQELSK